MPGWSEKDIQPKMRVYTSDNEESGHVAKVYEDSFLVHTGLIFPTDRYIPYSAIVSVENDKVQLQITLDEAKNKEWENQS